MKIKNILQIGVLVSTILFGSCSSSFLNLAPNDAIDEGEALNSDADLSTAVLGTYAGLRSSFLYGRGLGILGDLQADNILIANYNSGRYTSNWTYTVVNNNADFLGLWQNAYRVILRANNIINANPQNVTSQEAVNHYKGEAYALRALMYFNLANTFGRPYTDSPAGLSVPLVLSGDINGQPKRNTTTEVFDKIVSDLDSAYLLMSEDHGSGRLSKYAARGLAAKVQLFKGTAASNQLALQYAQEVIDESAISLVGLADYISYWSNTSAQANAARTETLFEVVSDNVDNIGTDELGYLYSPDGYGDAYATSSFYNTFSDDDVRKSFLTPGQKQGQSVVVVSKYQDLVNYDNKKVLRLSDVYLIAAEAAYSLGNEALAKSYLNTLVEQRYTNPSLTETGGALFERIISERRKELAFEGDRFSTLNRLKRDIPNRLSNNGTLTYDDYRRIAPISETEISRNPNLEQNPEW